MEFSRRGTTCQQPEHNLCSTCHGLVTRRSTHTHTFSRESGESALCADCFAIVTIAAYTVMQALESVGLTPGPRELLELVKSHQVAILIQTEFQELARPGMG